MTVQSLQDVVHSDIGMRADENWERHLPVQLEQLDGFDNDSSFTLRVVNTDSSAS